MSDAGKPSQADVIDLRSDTVTRPTLEMRAAIAAAEVGDDVLGDDPTVQRLEARSADLLGKPAAVYVPSGTMANQLAIRAQTEPGDEIIADANTHIFHYETGAPAALSGCLLNLVPGARGIFSADQVRAVIRPHDDHCPRSRLIVVENTHNRGGGVVWPVESVRAIRDVAEHAGLRVHLDGARLMNACIAAGVAPPEYTQFADTVSMCFSKGLGAPVGSILVGDEATIGRARRFRKMFGGTMRQAGLLAAGAMYALDHHVERLAEDHAHARRLAEGLNDLPGLSCDPGGVQTNIVMVEVSPELGTAAKFEQRLYEAGVWTFSEGPTRIRAVTHLDVSGAQIEEAIRRVGTLCRG